MDVWNESLVKNGTRIISERLRLLKILKENFLKYMSYFFSGISFDIFYVFSWAGTDSAGENSSAEQDSISGSGYISDRESRPDDFEKADDGYIRDVFMSNLILKMKKDIITKNTSTGPHRDDIVITLNGKDIRYFGSQGQQRISSICLRLAELEVLKNNIDKNPVLLLDDVLSELDIERKSLLLKLIGDDFQTFITAANYEYIKDIKLGKCEKYIIENNEFKLL